MLDSTSFSTPQFAETIPFKIMRYLLCWQIIVCRSVHWVFSTIFQTVSQIIIMLECFRFETVKKFHNWHDYFRLCLFRSFYNWFRILALTLTRTFGTVSRSFWTKSASNCKTRAEINNGFPCVLCLCRCNAFILLTRSTKLQRALILDFPIFREYFWNTTQLTWQKPRISTDLS